MHQRARGAVEGSCPPPSSAAIAAIAGERADRARETASRALDVAGSTSAELRVLTERVVWIADTLGHAPSPGRSGAGLVGAVAELQELVREFVRAEERRCPPPAAAAPARRRVARSAAVIALVAALGGGGGIAGVVQALRGGAPAGQTSGAPPSR